MSDAVFSISAEINPTINERELQRQGQALANQLNGILAKQVGKVGINIESGSFRPFQQELIKTTGFIDKLQSSIQSVPRHLSNLGKTGKSAFLKFTDLIDVTRRDMIGFGDSVFDTIRNTERFTEALDGIKSASSTIEDLPQRFEIVSAQIRSGTSIIDQFAAKGDKLAQFFQPLVREGEASRTEFVELNRSVDILTGAISRLAAATKGANDALISDKAAKSPFEKQIISAQELLKIVEKTPAKFKDVKDSIDAAFLSGSPEELLKQLVALKNQSQLVTGPLGRIQQLVNEATGGKFFKDSTKDARELQIALEQGLIAKIREFGGAGLLGPIENFNAKLRAIRDGVVGAARAFEAFRTGLAKLLPGTSPIGKLVDSAADAVTFFKVLKAEGVPALQAVRGAFIEAFTQFKGATGITTAVTRVKAELTGLGLAIVQTNLGQKINQSLGQIGNFLQTNLVGPLKAAGPQIKAAFAPLGQSIVEGLKVGLQSAKNVLLPAIGIIRDNTISAFKKVFGIHSPADTTKPVGKSLIEGIAAGMKGALNLLLAPARAALDLMKTAFKPLSAIGKVAGAAFAALGTVALTTGLQFNSLQQVINATLPVLLGSAEASKTLLKQINDLNDSSPFARSSFLELTRVLAGFGVQAEKIAPLIDAIQQAVAATGGGEQDLLDLGQAFARLQSQGRLSLDIIQSFSSRGIDVISLLGGEFQKTNGQIREMISNGLIPADKAIDALTKGLKEKFDGATEAVSKNLPGALDRIKAKLRDAGAELTRAFVNPEGGGALVTFLNDMATSLNHITKNILVLLRPALEGVGKALTTVSGKVKTFVTSLGTAQVSKFVESLSGLAPVLAGAAALLPGLLSGLPVIGGFLAAISGPEVALIAALATIKPVRNAFIDLAAAIAPIVQDLLPKVATFFKAASDALGPFIAKVVGAIGPVFAAIGQTLGELFKQLGPITQSLGRLFDAISPVVDIVKNAAILYFQSWQAAISSIGPIITKVIDKITEFAEKLKPALQNLADFTATFIQSSDQIEANAEKLTQPILNFIKLMTDIVTSDFAHAVFGVISTEVQFLIDRIVQLGGIISSFVKTASLGRIHLDFDFPVGKIDSITDKVHAGLKKISDDADEASNKLRDAFNKLAKDSETANNAVDTKTDALKQQLSTSDQLINGVIEAAKASKTALAAVADARIQAANAAKDLNKVEAERTKALRDVISPLNEVAVAERNLTRLRNDIRAGDREEIAIQEELNKLRGQRTLDDRAELDRGIERAKIALNSARRAELDLINESNKAETTSINIAGLSLEQIKGRLKTVRATLSAQKQAKTAKSAQQAADERTSAHLDVLDAEQNLKDVTESRQQFELDTTTKIRDNEERLLELRADKADKLLEEQNQLNAISDLRAGETSQQKLILDFEDKITAAKLAVKKNQDALTGAITASALAELDLKSKAAELRGDVQAQADLQFQIWDLKKQGLRFDNETITALGTQATTIHTALTDLQAAVNTANQLKEPLRLAAIAALTGTGAQASALANKISKEGVFDPELLKGLKEIPGDIKAGITSAFSSNAVLNTVFDKVTGEVLSTGTIATASTQLINDILQGIVEEQAAVQGSGGFVNFREIIKTILKQLNLSIPGFAGGYAPGDLTHSGLNNGVGLARMFEYGREAVLPLTRSFDMARIVRNPAVLPAILNALPRWSMPTGEEPASVLSSLITGPRSVPAIKGSGSASVDRRKEQNELAGSIGAAVKIAVMEALSESGGIGADVAINVASPTGNEVIIAREVARQVKKALGNPNV